MHMYLEIVSSDCNIPLLDIKRSWRQLHRLHAFILQALNLPSS